MLLKYRHAKSAIFVIKTGRFLHKRVGRAFVVVPPWAPATCGAHRYRVRRQPCDCVHLVEEQASHGSMIGTGAVLNTFKVSSKLFFFGFMLVVIAIPPAAARCGLCGQLA